MWAITWRRRWRWGWPRRRGESGTRFRQTVETLIRHNISVLSNKMERYDDTKFQLHPQWEAMPRPSLFIPHYCVAPNYKRNTTSMKSLERPIRPSLSSAIPSHPISAHSLQYETKRIIGTQGRRLVSTTPFPSHSCIKWVERYRVFPNLDKFVEVA